MEYLFGHSTDLFPVDDVLDFSNEEIFDLEISSSSITPPLPQYAAGSAGDAVNPVNISLWNDLSEELYIPSEDVAELEWLSSFMEDSVSYFPSEAVGNDAARSSDFLADVGVPGRARSKRPRATASTTSWSSSPTAAEELDAHGGGALQESSKTKSALRKKEASSASAPCGDGVRKCAHCATEKTPQWRTGPMGPKSLCNACGVRYKSGRLVPEYRPAASPTFVLTQHSNSHRKVIELRRQKELLQQQKYLQDFEVC